MFNSPNSGQHRDSKVLAKNSASKRSSFLNGGNKATKLPSPSHQRKQGGSFTSPSNTKNRLARMLRSFGSPDSARSSKKRTGSGLSGKFAPSDLPFSDLTASEREIMGHNASCDDADIAELQALFKSSDLADLDNHL